MVSVLLLALLTAGVASLPSPGARPAAEPLCVIANLPGDTVHADVGLIRGIFLLRKRFWPDGTPAHPVNLPAASPIRERFSQAVFGQSVRAQASYWSERYFHGTRPPPSVASQAAVILFVTRTKGSVGYVEASRTDTMPEGVRVLRCFGSGERG